MIEKIKKYAVVTGAASGIGKSVLIRLLSDNVIVFAIDKKPVEVEGAISIQCDISNEQEILSTTKRIASYTDKIDYLALAAGVLCKSERYIIEDLPIEEWNYVIQTNLTGNMLLIKHLICFLKKSETASVVTYSSEQVIRPIAKSAPYLVSKAGIEALTKLLALELIGFNIRVNCIRAATVRTNFLSSLVGEQEQIKLMCDDMNKKMPFGIIDSSNIADITVFLFSDSTNKITGQIITVDSGMLLI